MTRPYRPLAVILSAAIVTGSGLAAVAQGCPLSGLKPADKSVEKPMDPNSSGSSTQFSDSSEFQVRPLNHQPDIKTAGTIGFVAIVSATVAAIVYKLRHSQLASPISDEALLSHPELEHPELALTSIPREALASTAAEKELSLR